MLFRFRFKQLGGHVHVRVFVGQSANHTLANSGSLCLSPAEWKVFQDCLAAAPKLNGEEVEFLPDHERSLDP